MTWWARSPISIRPICIELLPRLSRLSVHGLATMYEPRSRSFAHTLRGGVGDCPPVARGMSVRYTAVAALGLSRTDPSTARDVLGGDDMAALLPGVLGLALAGRDAGALALSVWAALEVGDAQGEEVLGPADRERLSRAVERVLHHTRAPWSPRRPSSTRGLWWRSSPLEGPQW